VGGFVLWVVGGVGGGSGGGGGVGVVGVGFGLLHDIPATSEIPRLGSKVGETPANADRVTRSPWKFLQDQGKRTASIRGRTSAGAAGLKRRLCGRLLSHSLEKSNTKKLKTPGSRKSS